VSHGPLHAGEIATLNRNGSVGGRLPIAGHLGGRGSGSSLLLSRVLGEVDPLHSGTAEMTQLRALGDGRILARGRGGGRAAAHF